MKTMAELQDITDGEYFENVIQDDVAATESIDCERYPLFDYNTSSNNTPWCLF
jgi:hypothetical protein